MQSVWPSPSGPGQPDDPAATARAAPPPCQTRPPMAPARMQSARQEARLRVRWERQSMPDGVYFAKIEAGSFRAVRTIVLIR